MAYHHHYFDVLSDGIAVKTVFFPLTFYHYLFCCVCSLRFFFVGHFML